MNSTPNVEGPNLKDLVAYLHTYNNVGTYQGRGMEGRTPHQVFMDEFPKNEQASGTA